MANRNNSSSGGYERRKVGQTIGGVIVALILALMAIWLHNNTDPPISVPPKVSPSPNAFDSFKNAGNMLVNDRQVGDAVSATTTPPVPLAVKRQLVKSNDQALSTLREGFGYEYVDTSRRSFYTLFPYFAKFRGMARLLALESEVRVVDGDVDGAINSCLDAMQLGIMCPRGSVIIGDLVGVACQSIGRRPIYAKIDSLTGKQAQKAARRLENLLAKSVPFSDTLTEEKYMGIVGLAEAFKSKNTAGSLLNGGTGNGNNNPQAMMMSLYFLVHSKASIIHDYSDFLDAVIQHASTPYPEALSEVNPPKDPIVQVMAPVFSQARLKSDDALAHNEILLLMLALQAYHSDHHGYPQTLDELMPAYVKKVPSDPFAKGEPFKYRLKGSKYLLYSVGPDGKDDGGKAIDDPSKVKSGKGTIARYYVDPLSKGDIVAGVNDY